MNTDDVEKNTAGKGARGVGSRAVPPARKALRARSVPEGYKIQRREPPEKDGRKKRRVQMWGEDTN